MKNILIITLLLLSTITQAQEITEIENKPIACCQHLDEEFGETWTILYESSSLLDAQRLVDRYNVFDIYNEYFESFGTYYIELVDPSDTLEIENGFKLFTNYHKRKLIYIDFLVSDENKAILDDSGNPIMVK